MIREIVEGPGGKGGCPLGFSRCLTRYEKAIKQIVASTVVGSIMGVMKGRTCQDTAFAETNFYTPMYKIDIKIKYLSYAGTGKDVSDNFGDTSHDPYLMMRIDDDVTYVFEQSVYQNRNSQKALDLSSKIMLSWHSKRRVYHTFPFLL
jgi:hypothetical protein